MANKKKIINDLIPRPLSSVSFRTRKEDESGIFPADSRAIAMDDGGCGGLPDGWEGLWHEQLGVGTGEEPHVLDADPSH